MNASPADPARALRLRAVNHGVFGLTPAILTVGLIAVFWGGDGHLFGSDFQHNYWPGARHILHGVSPYTYPRGPVTLPFTYPGVGALLIAPFGLLPIMVGAAVFTALNLAALPVALRLLGVRDWRVHGLVLFWLPVIAAWETANVTLLLLCGIAALWHYRDHPIAAGVATALIISVKPITWPLALWLLATRRTRSLAWAIGAGLLLNAIAWSVLGFGEIPRFAHLMRQDAHHYELVSFTLVSLLLKLHVTSAAAYVLGLAPGVAACAACVRLGRRGRDSEAMTLCVAAILLCSSIAWLHYFALLIVPLALARPRLSAVWALPLVMWLCLPTDDPAAWQIGVTLSAAALVVGICVRHPALARRRRPVLAARGVPATGSLSS